MIPLTTECAEPEYFSANLLPGMSYMYRVRARNSVGYGGWSDASERMTTNPEKPDKRVLLGNVVSQTEISLDGKKQKSNGRDITRYELQVRRMSMDPHEDQGLNRTREEALVGVWTILSDSVPSDETSLVSDSLEPGIVYEYRLRARNDVGWSMSEITDASVTLSTAPGDPLYPPVVDDGDDAPSPTSIV